MQIGGLNRAPTTYTTPKDLNDGWQSLTYYSYPQNNIHTHTREYTEWMTRTKQRKVKCISLVRRTVFGEATRWGKKLKAPPGALSSALL